MGGFERPPEDAAALRRTALVGDHGRVQETNAAARDARSAIEARDWRAATPGAAAVFAAWQVHTGAVPSDSAYARDTALAAANPEEIAAILPACTAAARDWRATTPRGSLTLDWPWPEGKVVRVRGRCRD